ncbi:hypothetical protein CMI37_21935 [Candidatus Pacearchaeota archaeon]|nr:hypothetical protein [Candidatus Pacearchaeota archaeon]|tara:strand:+ start:1423 stop:2049 length:627 start_codon:yes stop_codon:yes gene_type:complete
MNNYFKTQRIHWNNFAPENIIFKSNNITKKLMPKENILSYSTKGDRDALMAKKSGATAQQNQWGYTTYQNNNHVAVHVKLIDVKKDFVGANIDFVDLREKKDSLGGHCSGLDVLVYIQSHHNKYTWKNTGTGGQANWQSVKVNPTPLPDDDPNGYMIAYGGQGDSNPMEHRELLEIADISEAVRQFLINMVLPLKRGELNTKALTLVA